MMAQETAPPDSPLDAFAPAPDDIEQLDQFRRSPHPYLHHRDQLRRRSPDPAHDVSLHSQSQSQTPPRPLDKTMRKTPSQSPSESGTEADDEGERLLITIPPSPTS